MDALVYFLIWAVLIAFMMRFGCGAHVMGRRQRDSRAAGRGHAGHEELKWIPPPADRDPVCGKTVATANARSSVYSGNVYYFCSRECREAFEVTPHLYLGGPAPADGPREDAHV